MGRLDGDLDNVLAKNNLNRDVGIFEVNLVPLAVLAAKIACTMDFPSSSVAGLAAAVPTRTRMDDEAALRDKLRKIEALFSGAARARIRGRLRGRGEAREASRDPFQCAGAVIKADVHRALQMVWSAALPAMRSRVRHLRLTGQLICADRRCRVLPTSR